jgi:exonuclease III
MRIITLNAQGLTDFSKFKRLLTKLKSLSPDVILFQEIFNYNINPERLKFIIQTWSTIWKGTIHATPFVATLIAPNINSTLTFESNDHRILDITITPSHSTQINIRNVYAPADNTQQRPFWTSFPPLPPSLNIVGGDFNAVLTAEDHISSTNWKRLPLGPYILPHLTNLIDTGGISSKPAFTSYHQRENNWSKSRIDYIFTSPTIFHSFTLTTHNMGSDSDHRALLLSDPRNKNNKSPIWRFNSSLLKSKKHTSAIEQIILSHPPLKNAHQWDDIKDSIKVYCQQAGRANKAKRTESIKNLTNRLNKLQRAANPNPATIASVTNRLRELEKAHSDAMAIRSRIKWKEEGERSTQYFMNQFHQHRRKTTINSLQIPTRPTPHIPSPIPSPFYTSARNTNPPPNTNNNITFNTSDDPEEIISFAAKHFKDQWSIFSPLYNTPLTNYIPSLTQEDTDTMALPIHASHVLAAINGKQPQSAPGPDGFTYAFYQHFRLILAPIMATVFNHVAAGLLPPTTWNETHTILIPKKNQDHTIITNLRPITLSNTDLKILSTIVAKRLQDINQLHPFIHPDQTGFMAKRQITNTILDINALLQLPNPPSQSFLLSLDWSKAYDRVSHAWLDHILTHLQLQRPTIKLIQTVYHHRQTSIFINGKLSPPFPIRQGVPQGDPLAPLLFNISIEPLFNALRTNMQGITVNQRTFTVRAYADDTYVGGVGLQDWSTLQLWIDRHLLAANGKMNWNKSTFYPLSPTSNYPFPPYPPAASLPLATLGVLLPITPENTTTLWNTLLQKAKNKAASFTNRNLTLRGRILILKSFILSTFWYHATVSPPPHNIITQLQTLANQVVWKNRHYHPKLDIASLPIRHGGINAPNIKIEMEIRLAKTLSQAYAPHTPFWIHVNNYIMQTRTSHNNIIQSITQRRSIRLPIEPLRSGLSACRKIENLASNTMATMPPLPNLRNILQSRAPTTPNTLIIPSVGPASWDEIFHKHRHRPATDILWLATWDRLPIGRPIATISPDNIHCPWCPNTEHSTIHLFHHCHIAQSVWDTTHMIYAAGTHTQPPPCIPNPALTPQQSRLLRSLQSTALLTLWNAFTTRAFGHNPTPSHDDILNQLLGRILFLRSIDIHIDPLTPWINPNKIQSIINTSKNRYIPPSPQ